MRCMRRRHDSLEPLSSAGFAVDLHREKSSPILDPASLISEQAISGICENMEFLPFRPLRRGPVFMIAYAPFPIDCTSIVSIKPSICHPFRLSRFPSSVSLSYHSRLVAFQNQTPLIFPTSFVSAADTFHCYSFDISRIQ